MASLAVQRGGSVSPGTASGARSGSGEREHLERSRAGAARPRSAPRTRSTARLPATGSDADALINKQQQQQ